MSKRCVYQVLNFNWETQHSSIKTTTFYTVSLNSSSKLPYRVLGPLSIKNVYLFCPYIQSSFIELIKEDKPFCLTHAITRILISYLDATPSSGSKGCSPKMCADEVNGENEEEVSKVHDADLSLRRKSDR